MSDKMIQIDDEWESTRICPCGMSFTWSDIDDGLEVWIRKHKPHTNKKLEISAGDGWEKVYADKPKTKVVDL